MFLSRPPILILVSFVLTAFSGCAKSEKAGQAAKAAGPGSPGGGRAQVQPVEVTQVVRRDLREVLSVVGSVASNESAQMRAEISGLVRGIFFNEGQSVKGGDVLVKIDDSEIRAQLAQGEARFELTRVNLERAENLRRTQSNTQADFDRARTEYATATADLAVLRLRLEKTEIKAPFDGIAGSRSLSPGDYVTSQSVITTIDDLSRLKIEFQVPERVLSKVRSGTRFQVSSRSLPSGTVVEGEVYFVSSMIDRNTRSSEVKGLLESPPVNLKPGMFANIEVVLDVRRNVLAVPEGSVLATPTGTTVIAVRTEGKDKVADFVRVDLGLRARGLVEVIPREGALDETTLVVASGVGGLILFDGAKVEPRPLKQEFRIAE
jgi:membrane fusion protein, multidrug efflux system